MGLTPDCLILGGGVAGLWTLRTLVDAGLDTVLVETRALGEGQTIASQGILHAGTKFALSGEASRASRAAGEAAAVWRACLDGLGPVDLREVPLLSRRMHLFTTPGIGSRLAGLAASRALAVGPRRLKQGEYPDVFGHAPEGVRVYALDEPVVDLPALLGGLAAPVVDRTVRADEVKLSRHDDGAVLATIRAGSQRVEVAPRSLVLAAGAGNEVLLALLGLGSAIRTQRRPLHMVFVRGDLPDLWGHCVGMSDKPRLTITTSRDREGRTVWYIGGQLAETGVGRDRAEQIDAARAELGAALPWIGFDRAELATLRVDRAEGFDASGRRPDTPVVRAHERVVACWPTKLVLAPLAAASVLREVETLLGEGPVGDLGEAGDPFASMPRPERATPIWDREDLAWS